MTQDERWEQHYGEVMSYMMEYRRRPSKHRPEDRKMLYWIKQNKRMMSRGLMPERRKAKFEILLETAKRYRHLNQYG